MNIDPFSQFEDSEIWDVLEQVGIRLNANGFT